MAEHPAFEAFKRRLLANPEVRRGYIEAKVRRNRAAAPVPVPRPESEGEH